MIVPNGGSEQPMPATAIRRPHDLGGVAAGPILRQEHDLEPWEKQVDAILRVLLAKDVLTLDELRRAIEELGPGAYEQLGYFERWIAAIANLLVEKGVLGVQELGQAIAAAHAQYQRDVAR